MHTPFLADMAQLHVTDLHRDAEQARVRRAASGPSWHTRIARRWSRSVATADPKPQPRPVVALGPSPSADH